MSGQALAWTSSASYHGMRGHYADARKALDRALAHATAAGDEPLQDETRSRIAFNLFHGAASLDELAGYAEKLLDQADWKGRSVRFLQLLGTLGQAEAMRGNFEKARTWIAEELAAQEDLGLTLWASVSTGMGFGAIEILAGDPAAAERRLSRAYSALEEASETGNLSSVAALLAKAVCAQGRYEEAERYTRISEATAARDDYASQILWRSVRAEAFAREGRVDDGEQLARQAVTLAEATDDINFHADALMALAEVLCLAERPGEAIPVIEEALRLYEQKGNVVSARKVRELLRELEALPTLVLSLDFAFTGELLPELLPIRADRSRRERAEPTLGRLS